MEVKTYDFTGTCPKCGGKSFYLSGFSNPHGGRNACVSCGYIPTETDKLKQRVVQLESLLKGCEDEIINQKKRITLRNRKIRSLRRALRNQN